MPKPSISPLPYFAETAALFSALAPQTWAVFLDSAHPSNLQGRYDIFAAEPVCTLVTHGDTTVISQNGVATLSTANPFDLVKQQLALWQLAEETDGLPFTGGAIGYFAYDLARRLETLPVIAEANENIPDMAVGIYAWAVIVDHVKQQSILADHGLSAVKRQELIDKFSHLPGQQPSAAFSIVSGISVNMDKASYTKAFDRIKHYLKEGDCYQVNLTQRFAADYEGEPWTAYQLLRQMNPAPFSCFLNLPGVSVLSSSPERFIKLENGGVETKPIKGTRPRKIDASEDLAQVNLLENSTKDRAENLMIVDLLRNDLGKSCKTGSIKVPKLFAVESYATVHHLVSTVTGELAEGKHALDLLKSCFPGGSITGAPKLRAMEVIEELEAVRRGLYCGAIGYVGFNGNMDTSIAIRTLIAANGSIRFWVGGGIVNDSVVDDEYQECFDKAAALLKVLQQLSVKR